MNILDGRLFRHYDRLAPLYDKARPVYPEAALRWVLGDSPLRVLDLAAGTGKLTGGLVRLGHEVVAVEPSQGMRAILKNSIGGVQVLAGTAEQIPLPDGSVDAVVVGQAYHWFDHRCANRELARVVRPGGVVGLLFNSSDKGVPWLAELTRMLLAAEGGEESGRTFAQQGRRLNDGFSCVESQRFPHGQDMTPTELLELVRTRPLIARLSAEDRACLLSEAATLIQTRLPERFTYPYVTIAYRALRGEV